MPKSKLSESKSSISDGEKDKNIYSTSREVVEELLDRATLSHEEGSCPFPSASQEYDIHKEIDRM